MADYAATVTLDLPRPERISKNYGFILGKCAITNYNQTGLEITDITRYFNDETVPIRVICDGVSSTGHMIRWDETDKCFHAFFPVKSMTATLNLTDDDNASTNGVAVYFDEDATEGQRLLFTSPTNVDGSDKCIHISANQGAEVSNDLDVGEVNFIAYGLIR
jgi:hypothetical protein